MEPDDAQSSEPMNGNVSRTDIASAPAPVPLPRRNKNDIVEPMEELSKMLSELNLECYKTLKLQLQDILDINAKNVKDVILKAVKHLPWNFLQKLMALNVTARNTKLKDNSPDQFGSNGDDDDPFSSFLSIPGTDKSGIHPLDVLCALLHCSDHFLQQEIVSKMSMCQFAVPLLLPAGDGTYCTLMLWAMRDIVKRWRPDSEEDSKGFMEENVVNVSMPTFSFVRLGKTKLSKSKILNQVLSPAHISHEFFVHRDMEGADVPRKVSDGLVEISWYFPRHDNDTFPGPVAVTNLRGDLRSNLKQLQYLSHVSTAVFMFVEKITEAEYKILADLQGTDTSFYFIISKSEDSKTNTVTAKHLTQLFPILKMDKTHVLVQSIQSNDTELVRMIQGIFKRLSGIPGNRISLVDMASMATEFEILVDEDSVECQNAKKRAQEITEGINNVKNWKQETMRLQGDTWMEISSREKEMCRRKKQGEKDSESYKSELKEEKLNLQREQNEHEMTDKMVKFCSAISTSSLVEKRYFMKWMKSYLDSISRKNLAKLQEQYKDTLGNLSSTEVKDGKPADIALGIEHFLRELGQFYEAECAMVKKGEMKMDQTKYSKLPGIAADLLLDGFPLELIDGDASNIPMQWITDILTELDTKTGGRCRMRVITVLGVQSTGKSTLLNTMFGLQFPVASGQCTRGAFMTLINVRENYRKELGCDFILVIDTEGLRSSASMSEDNKQEHDNELSTLVIGLSDITIINMAMENTADMKDILQIVVHAFLRMSKAGKKPNCQFAHQNVSDVSAPHNLLIERMQLMEDLNKMAQKSAKMEGNRRVTAFSDIIDYNHEEHSWYIPSLWHGIPPMASINSGYSKNVCKFKQHLFKFIKNHDSHQMMKPQDIKAFRGWLKYLWQEVKHEKFLFSFRNILVAEAYDNLTKRYSELEWKFQKVMHRWMTETENMAKNLPVDDLEIQINKERKAGMEKLLNNEEKEMREKLEEYFNNSPDASLIKQHENDFLLGVKGFRNKAEVSLIEKCQEVLQIQKGKREIQRIQSVYLKDIEDKVMDLLEKCKQKGGMSPAAAKQEFEAMWDEMLSRIESKALTPRDIAKEMLKQLKKEMENKGSFLRQKIDKVECLLDYGRKPFQISEEHIDYEWLTSKGFSEFEQKDFTNEADDFAASLIDDFHSFITQKVTTKEGYHEIYCRDLLNMINGTLTESAADKLCTKRFFELDLKLHILGEAAERFQKMHDDFIQENDPKQFFNKFKSQYSSAFDDILKETDDAIECAKSFLKMCLKPAIMDFINKNLGQEMVDDMLDSDHSLKYKSRSVFQYHVLKELLEKDDFNLYVEYIHRFESFAKKWISENISGKYETFTHFEKITAKIISSITEKIREVLKDPSALECSSLGEFLEHVCRALNKELVISQNDVKAVLFNKDKCTNIQQFSDSVNDLLAGIDGEIFKDLQELNVLKCFLSGPTMNTEEILFRQVIGCRKQCPFCKAPCEVGGGDHETHRASVHRPKGLARHKWLVGNQLCNSPCSTDICSDKKFRNADTKGDFYLYKEYQEIYPEWEIEHEQRSAAYWKFVFNRFNKQFAEEYGASQAHILKEWKTITREEALKSLEEMFNTH